MPVLDPVMLAGLGGAAVPVVIHLIHRRRAPEHPFPTIGLLLRSQKRVRTFWKLRHLLVMLACCDLTLADVEAELARRLGTSGLDEKASRGRP